MFTKVGIPIGIVLSLILVVSVMGYTKVPAGYEGVKINTLGGGKGALEVKGVGRNFYNGIKYDFETFPLFKQNYVWTAGKTEGSRNDESITFQSKESLTFNTDVGISYSVIKGQSADIYADYRKDIEIITDIDMRNSVRDAFNRLGSQRSVEEIYGQGKSDFIKAVHADVSEYWTPYMKIHKIYLVGEMRPPAEVKAAISAKIGATQKAQQRRNEVKQAEAEADKKIADARGTSESRIKIAEGEAKAIELINETLARSPKYVEYIKANKWDGRLPQFVGGGAIPMITLNK
jgi:regulator of protease activity HflC (stomatin/prohibitin superfamily)